MPPLDIQVLQPFSTYSSPSRRALVCMAATSEPASGSDRAKAAMYSPLATFGRYCSFRASLANIDMEPLPRPCMAKAKSARPE